MYTINQIFIDSYPASCASWCNQNNAYIEEIEPQNGHRRFQIVAIPEPTQEELEAQAFAQAKSQRAEAVSNIKVTVDGLVFDGDETSQDRMARALTMYNCAGLPPETTTAWVLADNTVAQVTVAQLAQALLMAGQAQTALWLKPYEDDALTSSESLSIGL